MNREPRRDYPSDTRLPAASEGLLRNVVLLTAVVLAAGCGGAEQPRPRAEADSAAASQFESESWNTDFSRRSVPLSEVVSGGPPKDGIPAIDAPRFVPATEADEWLEAREPVIALTVRGETRAYPIQILIWHEIVNDQIRGIPVAVTFCPLCNTAIVFDRRVRGRTLDFGTTGKLRNSDLVMYDRQTESWWQQFGGEAIVGHYTGTELRHVPARIVAWAEFEGAHADGLVLSRDTGHDRAYGDNPYAGYDDVSSSPVFAAENADDKRLLPKERVVFIERGEHAVAVPFSVLKKRKTIRVTVGTHRLVVRWQPGVSSALDSKGIAGGRDIGTVDVREDGKLVTFDQPFWFAVAAFRPDVEIVR